MQLYEKELVDNTLIIVLAKDLVWTIYEQAEEVDELVAFVSKSPAIINVVVDFHKNRAYSTGTLQVLARVWSIIRQRNGQMALCCVSETGMQAILRTNLHEVWPLYPSREDALAAVGSCSA